ncbi:1,4-alpha-glucan branching protein GlgB [Alisedimentitalea sp. MJ-SS2]|uniref:1,4-alpha-glucan branching protein GlgB n=1 Tax=Aliisedimentitalea sp. MJ-SS2 TaxID=3049795 RepID=UPI00290ED033|nr:1,4-alpha-glucan branching protein GlgB [Alisedimentitalea sp. MJ-SS2]MDU8928616.1 1,4-alpha-glucan branching protein GlgB [Alisedimentitalea sp. MJ-SS2]
MSDPFAVLGPHKNGRRWSVTALVPGAESVEVLDGKTGKREAVLHRLDGRGLFSGYVRKGVATGPYRLRAKSGDTTWEQEDAYRFAPVLGEMDEYLISEGAHLELWNSLGAHPMTHQGTKGVHFAVWAPSASRVSVVGEFNQWDGRRHVMRSRGTTGVWEIFVPALPDCSIYKYEIRDQAGNVLPLKADPVGFGAEHPPSTASVVRDLGDYAWSDNEWMATRAERNGHDQPISIYEVHLGSWKRKIEDGNRPLSYLEFASELVAYVRDMGFTHIELMPISEFPFDGSWGYQPIGLFAPTIRYGTPDEFRHFVNACHRAGLGVLLDWVPGHFPTDEHGLGQFDGTPLYEHADPREGFHQDWNTLIYNYGRREVQNFLVANALYWIKEFHLDGLRVDAVASMLYRDYSRNDGEWVPNEHGGRENLEAIAFLQRTNELVYKADAGVMMVAEESTSFPGVSKPTDQGGLGFGFKWNMGWMNDTLDYIGRDPIHRSHHHHQMTFGLTYAFSENFMLPISHDEVVHGKGSMLSKMPGDGFDKFACLRAYYGFMWGHPGKKLLFMGQEFAQGAEWNHDQSLDWHLLDHAWHSGMQGWVKALNNVYGETPTLYQTDCNASGFYWLEVDQSDLSVYAWVRQGKDGTDPVLVVCNFTPTPREGYRLGVPNEGRWDVLLNSNAEEFGGSGHGPASCDSEAIAWSGQSQSIGFDLPGNTAVFFRLRNGLA